MTCKEKWSGEEVLQLRNNIRNGKVIYKGVAVPKSTHIKRYNIVEGQARLSAARYILSMPGSGLLWFNRIKENNAAAGESAYYAKEDKKIEAEKKKLSIM